MRVSANRFDRMWSECGRDCAAAISRVGESGWYVLGQEVAAFEADLADFCGSASAVGCANGMDAIEIALRVSGLGPGDKVLTSSLSAFATCLAILRSGAEPVFCDIDHHGLIDCDAVEQALADDSSIRGIVPVHLYGHLADMVRIGQVAARHDVVVIEDAAQAIGATRDGMRVGADGRIACFSFYPTKNLGAIGDGGALIFHDAAADELARTLRNYGQVRRYVHNFIGLNSRLDELHAAVLRQAFLPRLNAWIETRRRIARAFLTEINTPHVTTLPGPDPAGSVWHLFPILVAPERRENFLEYLSAQGVEAGLHYPVLMSDQKALRMKGAPSIFGNLDTARRFATSEVSLPIHPYLTDAEHEHVIKVVNAWDG